MATTNSVSTQTSSLRAIPDTANSVVKHTEGAAKIAEFSFHVLSYSTFGNENRAIATSKLDHSLRNFHGMVSGFAFIRKLHDWSKYDSSKQDTNSTLFSAFITSFYFFSFIRYLNRAQFIKLGASLPIIGRILDISCAGACLTDIRNSIKNVRTASAEKSLATRRISIWTKRASATSTEWSEIAQERLDYWNINKTKIGSTEKIKFWTDLSTLKEKEATSFIEGKVKQYKTEISNANKHKITNWASIAFDVSVLASLVLAFFVSTYVLIIASIVTSILEITWFSLDMALKQKEVPTAPLPARIQYKHLLV